MIQDQEIENFLEHYGKKGMKWGQRRTAKIQGRLDRTHRIATGKASLKDRALGSALTAKGAQRQLQRGADFKAKQAAGKKKVFDILSTKKEKQRLKDLNFHAKGDANAKMDKGQKAAAAFLLAFGAAQVAVAVKNR